MSIESLFGPRSQLRRLQAADAKDLVAAATNGALWNLPFTVVPSAETVDEYIHNALEGYAAGIVLPFVTLLRQTDQVIGSNHARWPQEKLSALQHHR